MGAGVSAAKTTKPRRARVGAYIRVSRVMGRGGDSFLSPDLQLSAVERWANSQFGESGWRLVEVFKDMDASGTSMDRKQLRRAFEFAAAGKIDVLALYDLSRWARCVADGLSELTALEATGCKVASTSEQIDMDSPEGELSITMMLAIHQYKARQAARSWQHTIAAQGERGQHHGRAPFGYWRASASADGNGRGLLPDPEQAPIVQEIFRRYADGEPASRIEDDLHMRGLPLMRIKRMIANPIYIGYVIRREHVGKAVRSSARPKSPPRRRLKAGTSRAFGEGVQTFRGRHEPLIDEAIWDRCQARMEGDQRSGPRHLGDASHAFAKVAVCDHCGMALVRQFYKSRSVAYLRDNNGGRAHGCPGIGALRLDEFEPVALAEVVRVADKFEHDLEAALAAADKERRAAAKERAALEARDSRLRDRLVDLAVNRDDVRGGDDIYDLAAARLEAERKAVQTRLAQIRSAMPAAPSPELVTALRGLADAWPDLNIQERNRLARQWVHQIRVRRAAFRGEPLAERIRVVPR
jgi:DNA invertase Pin-like site-specific DNA recombinase